MGGVIIAPNVHRSKVQIDQNGNEINPKTKEIIAVEEKLYVPTSEELATLSARPPEAGLQRMDKNDAIDVVAQPQGHVTISAPTSVAPNPLAVAIKAQVDAMVKKQLEEINIKQMVADAIAQAFK